MNLIKHQDTGARGLRIAATVIVVLGWLSLVFCLIAAVVNINYFFGPLAIGVGSVAFAYLMACVIRGFASIVEAAELYWLKNHPESEDEDSY